MEINFNGQVALITSAASGMGFVAARSFAESGAKVLAVTCDVSKEEQEIADVVL